MRRALMFAVLAVGCGRHRSASGDGVPPVAPEPLAAPPSPAGLATIEGAEAELEQARRELEASTAGFGVANVPAATAGAAPPTAAPAAPPPAAQAAPRPERDAAETGKPKKRAAVDHTAEATAEQAENQAPEPPPCATPCKAFASLVRAKDAVCRLDEPNGARCRRAESIVREAEARIASCACDR